MKTKHMNALLMEIMMAVLFFALCAAVILELFSVSHSLNQNAEAVSSAANLAQNLSQQIYAADDVNALLSENGFVFDGEVWWADVQDCTLQVATESSALPAGEMLRAQLTVLQDGEEMVSLPCARYLSGEVRS